MVSYVPVMWLCACMTHKFENNASLSAFAYENK